MQSDGVLNNGRRDKKKIILVSVLITVLFFGALVGIMVQNNDNQDHNEENESVEVSELVFDTSVLNDTIGPAVLSALVDDAEVVIMMPDELSLVGENEKKVILEAFVDQTSFIKDIYFPYTTFSLLLSISDGRYYEINIAANGERYCGVLVRRTLPSYGQPYLYITNFDDSVQDWNSAVDGIIDWAKSIYPDGFIVTTNS